MTMKMKTFQLLPALLSLAFSAAINGASAASSPLPSPATLLASLAVLLPARANAQQERDDDADCAGWADAGECSLNPRWMLGNCPSACRTVAEADRETKEEIDKRIGHINSFFELEAEDIDKRMMKFDQFKGKVTVITNVASHCGYTESHYNGLVELYDRFKSSPLGFNILAFPCNQFGEQEPQECPAIKRFAENKGVEFTMMNKVDVNGVDAHPAYHYLKKVAGPPRITWNFATYYIVTPDGVVASQSGVEPNDLVPAILEAMGAGDDSSNDDEDEREQEL